MSDLSFWEALRRYLDEGRPVAVATVVRASGSVPRRVGAKMIVAGRGEIRDTIGGGSFEALAVEDALAVIASGVPELKRYTFSEGGDDATGQVCGGTVDVFIEPVLPDETLLILGAGHVGQALARCAMGLGLQVTVADDRPQFVRPELFPPAARLVLTDALYEKDIPPPDARTWVAVLTRCHQTDRLALARALSGSPRWVGLIGSRRKKLRIFQDLQDAGVPAASLETVSCPVGLDIGAETPAEIAVAIVAEIVSERRRAVSPAAVPR